MNCIVPFSKEIKFRSNIGEISSISLEHEFNLNDETLLGNFIVSGEYKIHELSVNKETFSYTLPFDVTLNNKIQEDTLSFEIDDFKYHIEKPDILKVEIDFYIKGEDVEEIFFEERPENLRKIFEEEMKELEIKTELENVEEEKPEEIDETIIEVESIEDRSPEVEVEKTEEVETRINENNKAAILNFAQNNEESFITYNIHIVKEGESIESICKIYNKNENNIKDYNMISKINIGDKILIPQDE